MADDDEEWRFSVDEVGPGDEGETDDPQPSDAEADSDAWGATVGEDGDGPTVTVGGPERAAEELEGELGEDGGNVAGTLAPEMSVEPGTPDFENVVFATIGAAFTALVFAGLLGLDSRTTAGILGAIVVAAGALYAVFRRF
jgi:hypothetical protein